MTPDDEATLMAIVTGAVNALAPVARTNQYADLDGRPTIPTRAADIGAEPAGVAADLIATALHSLPDWAQAIGELQRRVDALEAR